MDESCYGLIVEGPYDESVLSELVRRIISPNLRVIALPCGGVSKLLTKFPGYLVYLEHAWNDKPVDKAFVIRDWSGPDLASAEREMAQKIEGRRFSFPHTVQFCAVRQEMETWLLADAEAINIVADSREGRHVSPVQGELEEISDPKARLVDLLSDAKLPYDAKVCGEIAQRTSLDRLRYRCASFRSFEEKVIDC